MVSETVRDLVEAKYCDFCGKLDAFVKILIASPKGRHICDECIDLSAEIVAKERVRPPGHGCAMTRAPVNRGDIG